MPTTVRQIGAPLERFAVGVENLKVHDTWEMVLRWLCEKKLVKHLMEITDAPDQPQQYSDNGAAPFGDRSRFVLTESGLKFSRRIVRGEPPRAEEVPRPPGPTESETPSPKPVWNEQLRELRFGEDVIKLFRRPAPRQERILAAFQEEGWPQKIDDPLPPDPGKCPRERLRYVIRRLNKNHLVSRIRFHGDGTGQGIVWESVRS